MIDHPDVQLDIYVDDITISVFGADEDMVFQRLSTAAEHMAEIVEHRLKCAIALDKAAVLAASDSLLQRLRTRLGARAGDETMTAANLGVDHTAGRQKRAKHTPK